VDRRPTVDAQPYLNLSDLVLPPLGIFKLCNFFFFFLGLNVRLRVCGKFERYCVVNFVFFFFSCAV
jgi:hypothetical protein